MAGCHSYHIGHIVSLWFHCLLTVYTSHLTNPELSLVKSLVATVHIAWSGVSLKTHVESRQDAVSVSQNEVCTVCSWCVAEHVGGVGRDA